jgi:hypothetical protein
MYQPFSFISFLLFTFCFYQIGNAQTTQEPTKTESATRDMELWGNVNIEGYFGKGSFWFAETNWRYSSFQYAPNLQPTSLYRIQQKIGYEQYLDKNWSIGFSVRGVLEKNENQLFTQVYLNHVSSISKHNIELIKNLSLERIDSDNSFKKPETRINLGLALAKTFAINQQPRLRPSISYNLSMYHFWLLNSHSLYNRRTFDLARLQLEMAVFLSKNLTLSLFYLDQTNYFVAEPEFKEINGEMKESKPLRNLNITTPILGIRLHLQLFKNRVPENIRLRFLPY